MNESELDQLYTDFCQALAATGEADAMRALCRFALLAMLAIDDPKKIGELTRRALTPAARGEPALRTP